MQQVSAITTRANRKPLPLTSSKAKLQQKDASAKKQMSNSEVPTLSIVPSDEPVASPRIMQALKEESDASESLSDIRDLLMGPVTRLHEARIEELLSIFEEADRGNRDAIANLNYRGDALSAMCDKNQLSIAQTNETLRLSSTQQATDLVVAIQDINHALKEMFQTAEANIQKHSAALNERVTNLATRSSEDHQTLLAYFTKRIDELEIAAVANDERNLLKLESQMAVNATDMKAERSRDLESISECFADFSDRLLVLCAGKPRAS